MFTICSEKPENFIVQTYVTILSIILALVAAIFAVVEFMVVGSTEKTLKDKIIQNKIQKLREKELVIKLGTYNTNVEAYYGISQIKI
ncbi:hypothetical protein B6U96_13100 [Archaeoglobales archaeon ex4484_92]|nr:MAG: hypothetical protein B6U96_13100 [Archaeoglobales archaeon ex4484_92]